MDISIAFSEDFEKNRRQQKYELFKKIGSDDDVSANHNKKKPENSYLLWFP